MARRRTTWSKDPEVCVQYDPAIATAKMFEQRAMREFAPATYTVLEYVESAYDADLLRILREGFKVTSNLNDRVRTKLHRSDWKIENSVDLIIDFEELGMLAPTKGNYLIPTGTVPEKILLHWDEMRKLHQKWMDVRNVCQWLNDHKVTLGAARYYWPTILMLMPDNVALAECGGQRYKEVQGISEIIPTMRETSATVATMKLLPPEDKSKASPPALMQLSFDSIDWFVIA